MKRSKKTRLQVLLSVFVIAAAMVVGSGVAHAVTWSTYFSGSTNYNVSHWKSTYTSRGGEGSATTTAGNTICGYTPGFSVIKCSSQSSWSNKITYPQQSAANMCKLYDIGFGGSGIQLTCYKGT